MIMTNTNLTNVIAKFDRLDSGAWGVALRITGADRSSIAGVTGQTVRARRKDGSMTSVVLGEMVADWGDGDVTVFAVA